MTLSDPMQARHRRLLGFEELRSMIGRGSSPNAFRVWVWRQTRAGTFPRAVKVSPSGRAWHEDEIIAWLENPRS